jgi:hypothetical protein
MAFADATGARTLLKTGLPLPGVEIKANVVVKIGDLLYYSSGWCLATASASTQCIVAGQNGVGGDKITCYGSAVISGGTGATAGGTVYNAAAGAYAESGTYKVGLFLNATSWYVGPTLTPAT